jgi:proline-specific peptidase
MPADVRETIERCEAAETFDDPAYQAASFAFYSQHLCRLPMPWPEYLLRTVANTEASPVYPYMWGPSEFTMTGTLSSWDRTARLGEINVPTLVLCGEYDEAAPPLSEELRDGIRGSELVVFEGCSHLAHLEDPERFHQTLRGFLSRTENA